MTPRNGHQNSNPPDIVRKALASLNPPLHKACFAICQPVSPGANPATVLWAGFVVRTRATRPTEIQIVSP